MTLAMKQKARLLIKLRKYLLKQTVNLFQLKKGNQIKVDDNFTIYERTDSKIKDTYTGETLGNVEKVVGKATIIDSNAKFSVAQITEQKYDLIEDFKPRKYMVKPIKEIKKKKSSTKTKKKKKPIDQEW